MIARRGPPGAERPPSRELSAQEGFEQGQRPECRTAAATGGSDLPNETDDPTRAAAQPTAGDLIERYGDMVFNLALRLTADREEAADLAQDAFLRIVRGSSTFRGESTEKTWVFQVVVNCHRNRQRWWRRLKRGRPVSLEAPLCASDGPGAGTLGDSIADPGAGPEGNVAGAEARRRLEAELVKLPGDQRAVILLREVEGLDYSEIARALGVPLGTIKSRLSRAREALRAALADLREGGRRK